MSVPTFLPKNKVFANLNDQLPARLGWLVSTFVSDKHTNFFIIEIVGFCNRKRGHKFT
jgi:hypothetical protein